MEPTQEQIKALVATLNKATLKEVITIETREEENLALIDSKFGGYPYVPKDGRIPRDSEGNPFFMVAQINCEQLPENSIYPKKGLLQFWIIDGDDLFGLDLQNPCSNVGKRILYFPKPTDGLSLDEVKLQYVLTEEYTPMTKREEGITLSDVNFDRLFTDMWNETFSDKIETIWDLPQETRELLGDLLPEGAEHRIGGYPYFTQQDPREEDSPFTELLLQMDSDGDHIMWGTMGVANFFINKKDLQNCNFEEVLYNWDC